MIANRVQYNLQSTYVHYFAVLLRKEGGHKINSVRMSVVLVEKKIMLKLKFQNTKLQAMFFEIMNCLHNKIHD